LTSTNPYIIITIAIDRNEILWISIWGGGLVKFDKSEWEKFNTSNSGLPNDSIRCIDIDSKNNKWIGTVSGGVAKFDEIDWVEYNTSNSKLPNNYSECLYVRDNDDIWVGTKLGGLVKFNETDNTQFAYFDISNSGLPSNQVQCIAVDQLNEKWIGTDKGMSKSTDWKVFNEINTALIQSDIKAIAIDVENNKWFGTGFGLAFYNDSSWSIYTSNNSGLANDDVLSLAIDTTGSMWIGTESGLACLYDSTWIIYNSANSGLPDDKIICIAVDTNSTKWIGTGSGLAHFDDPTWIIYNSVNSVLPDDKILSIAVDSNGTKWIGTESGLARFDNPKWTVYNSSDTRLPSDTILCLAVDSANNKWVGTRNGLTKFDDLYWTTYNSDNSGLSYNGINCIIVDKTGDKWMGTNSGLVSYSEKITTTNVENTFCSGDVLDITFSTKEIFNSDNIFTAQLSDSSGNFSNHKTPITLNSISERESSTITIIIPDVTEFSTKYRLRVSGSSPFARGSDNGIDITINPQPQVIINGNDKVLTGYDEIYSSNKDSNCTFEWSVQGGVIVGSVFDDIVVINWNDVGNGKVILQQIIITTGCMDTTEFQVSISDDNPSTELAIDNIESYAGEIIDIPIYLRNSLYLYNSRSMKISFKVSFNSTILEPVNETDLLPSEQNDDIFTVFFEDIQFLKDSANQIIEVLHFLVKYDTIMETALVFSEVIFDSNDVSYQISDGMFYLLLDSLIIEVGSVNGKAGDTIQVSISLNGFDISDSIEVYNFEASLRFNSNLLNPIDHSYKIDNNNGNVAINKVIENVNNDNVLDLILFKARLGDVKCTDLELIDANLTLNRPTQYSIVNGEFCIEICEEGGDRLIESNGKLQLFQSRPNPSYDFTVIDFSIIERGYYELILYNIFGEKMQVMMNSYLEPGFYKHTLGTIDLAIGTYFYVLKTPSHVLFRRLEVVR